MAWTTHDVTLRLRRELDDPSLVVRFDSGRERFAVFTRARRLTAPRRQGFNVLDDGAVVRSTTAVFREFVWDEQMVYCHEGPAGEFLPLEPNEIRRGVVARDNRHGDVARRVLGEIKHRRESRERDFEDNAGEIAKESRRAFARAADEMGW